LLTGSFSEKKGKPQVDCSLPTANYINSLAKNTIPQVSATRKQLPNLFLPPEAAEGAVIFGGGIVLVEMMVNPG
jgi:hypothetical protein